MRQFLAVLSGLIVVTAWGYILFNYPENQLVIITLPFVGVVVGLLVYQAENIASIGAEIKGAKFHFEMQRARKEYWARMEALKELAEGVVELMSSEISLRGRFVDEKTFDHELLDKRNSINKLLKTFDSSEETIHEIVAPIEKMVLLDLKQKLFKVVDKNRSFRTDEPEKSLDVVHTKIEEIINTSREGMLLENLTPYLEELGVSAEKFNREIEDLEKFRSTKTL